MEDIEYDHKVDAKLKAARNEKKKRRTVPLKKVEEINSSQDDEASDADG